MKNARMLERHVEHGGQAELDFFVLVLVAGRRYMADLATPLCSWRSG